MSHKPKSDEKLVNTGTPNDPAKKENPDTREDQLKPYRNPDQDAGKDDNPALETTRKAGQGSG